MEYRQLKRENVGVWVKNLLKDRDGPLQIELLKKTLECSAPKYATYIEKAVAHEDSSPYQNPEDEVPSLFGSNGNKVVELTAGHMYSMPPVDITKLYLHWKKIPYETAAMPTFWGATTLQSIRDGVIEPKWLAVGYRDTQESAIASLDKAIQGQEKSKSRDDMVRRILRWMMGPGQMRGAPELYGNCSLAKAWWCGYIAHECANDESLALELEEATEAFAAIWPEYSAYLAGRLTAAGLPSVYRGLALWTRAWLKRNVSSKLTNQRVRLVLNRLGEVSSWCMLGLKPPHDIQELTNRIDLSLGKIPTSAD